MFTVHPVIWLFLIVGISVLYRKSRGKPIYPRKPEDSIFYESWASGHSKRDILTMMGGARNCLTVAVTPINLVVQPHFPFNLMFLPEIYDLEYNISRQCIRSVAPIKGIFGTSVRVEMELQPGSFRTIQLWLKNRDAFIQAMAAAL